MTAHVWEDREQVQNVRWNFWKIHNGHDAVHRLLTTAFHLKLRLWLSVNSWNYFFLCRWLFTGDFFFFFKMPLDVIRNELSNSILSLQPEPEIPPELPPPRPHVRCCWLVTSSRVKSMSRRVKKVSVLLCTTIIWQFLVALCYSSQSYTLTCKYANMQSYVGFNYNI